MKIRAMVLSCILIFLTTVNSIAVFAISNSGVLVIKSTNPANKQQNVKTDASISVTFGGSIQKTSMFGKIKFVDQKGIAVKYTASINKNVLKIQPASKLKVATSYVLYIPTGAVTDTSARLKNKEFKLEFKTQMSAIAKKEKTKFDIFQLGSTYDECIKELGKYDLETMGKDIIRINNYMNVNGKSAKLTLAFSNELAFDKEGDMKQLDDYRLFRYSLEIEKVDYNYSKKLVQEFCKLYGKPESNDFIKKNSENRDEKSAIWELDELAIKIHEYMCDPRYEKDNLLIGFQINDKAREKFKQYII